ncbi:MAG: SurA N-terminal domain-containing protein [Chloroflexota bacterium]|nr:SurA N-terminal domain-containing protein [Chloroflexota bacterium]
MAKKSKKRVSGGLTRKQHSRLERERKTERFLIWGVVVVAIVIVGVLGYGLVVEKVIKAREPVAVIGGSFITTAEFQSRERFAQMQIENELQYWAQQQQSLDPTDPNTQFYLEYIQGNIRDLQAKLSSPSAIGEQVLNQLIQEELVRQEMERRGIAVTAEEVQRKIELYFGYDQNPATPTPMPTVTPSLMSTEVLTPTPTAVPLPTATLMTEEEFRQSYGNYLEQTLKPLDISEQQFRSWFEASLLVEKLQEQMSAEVPTVADQVKLLFLAVDSEEQAHELVARLDAGEDFQTLADELEEDEEVTGYGTELDWFPKDLLEDNLGAELADLAFSLEVGERSQPVLGQDGVQYYIVEVVGHEERELDPFMRQRLGTDAFQEWIDAQQILVERKIYGDRPPEEQ